MTSPLPRLWFNRPTLSVELENKGSVARDHLAGERTFLAWLRTSLALVSVGVAVAQLFKLPEIIQPESGSKSDGTLWTQWMEESQAGITMAGRLDSLEKLGKPLGATCIAMGALCLVMGAYRYYVVQRSLIQGVFPPSRVEISIMALLVGAFIIAAFGIIVGVNLKGG